MNHIKKYGIDSLYIFFESNENYDDFYLEIYDQVESLKAEYFRDEIVYDNKNIHIRIKDINLQYLGTKEGFYWFRDDKEFFRIGFKDSNKNKGLHNIRVQLEGNGIYTFGINSIINLLKNDLLDEYITGYIPISRVDINCFIQCDLSFIDKTMFSTRKRKYSTINEIGSAKETQTIYIGKPPFKLRLYNKTKEMKQSKKYDVMREYFLNNDFDLEESIFNVEFEMHRSHLRNYGIDDLKELLPNIKNLFSHALDEIRMIDINSVSDKKLAHNKYEALTHDIWIELKEDFKISDFNQSSFSLQRIKREVNIFNERTYKNELKALFKKGLSRNLEFELKDLADLFILVKKEMGLKKEIKLLFDEVKDYKKQRNEYFNNLKS